MFANCKDFRRQYQLWIATKASLREHPEVSMSLILLRHKCCWEVVGSRGALQHGHRWRLLARATVRRLRMVAIEFGMCRSGRIGGASGSVTWGNGRFLEVRGDTRS